MSIIIEQSSIIGFNHAFFGRDGGVSEGQYSSLNVASKLDDKAENVTENRRRALESVHMDVNRAVFLSRLPHSNSVIAVGEKAKSMQFNGYDTIMTNTANLPIGLSTADCMPIILADEINGAVAVCHAGWRGIVASAPQEAVLAMTKEYGTQPEQLKVSIGPSISPDVYVVEQEVAKHFDDRYKDFKGNSIFLDLWTAAEDQLYQSGVKQIDNLKIDTYSSDKYFSYRQDKGDTGRQLSIISL